MRLREVVNADDARLMRRALRLAERGAGQVAPNPKVGAVIVKDGVVLGAGWHARHGEAHAEVMALRAAGDGARGATAYVTLEPCNHHGSTPPCSRALIDAGIARVVFAAHDPNPVASGGAEALRAANIEVQGGVLQQEAERQNALFLGAVNLVSRPFVTLKLALSVDGALVDRSRARAQLTGPTSVRAVHAMRAEHDAVAVGIGTVLADDAALTVRYAPAPRIAPTRVVFDRRARLPLHSALVRTAGSIPVVVLTDGSVPSAEAGLRDRGVTVISCTSIAESVTALRSAGIRTLLVEGGAGIASALVEARMVDRLITFQAPVLLGAGALSGFATLDSASAVRVRLDLQQRRAAGRDLLSVYAVGYGEA